MWLYWSCGVALIEEKMSINQKNWHCFGKNDIGLCDGIIAIHWHLQLIVFYEVYHLRLTQKAPIDSHVKMAHFRVPKSTFEAWYQKHFYSPWLLSPFLTTLVNRVWTALISSIAMTSNSWELEFVLCGQMFVSVGHLSSLFSHHCWSRYSQKLIK